MSIKLMNQIWGLKYPDSQKIVMLALADQANYEGLCWPSISTIATRCSKTGKTVIAALRQLEKQGDLTIIKRPGTSSYYRLHPLAKRAAKPTTPPLGYTPPLDYTPTPPPGYTQTTNRTINEPPYINKREKKRVTVERPPDINPDIWRDFQILREAKRAPITHTAIKAIEREAVKAGLSIESTLVICIEKNWLSFQADWIKDNQNGTGTGHIHGDGLHNAAMDAIRRAHQSN